MALTDFSIRRSTFGCHTRAFEVADRMRACFRDNVIRFVVPSDKRNLARYFRNNMTLSEVLLWNQLKQDQIGFHIRRQYQFDGFILDFYCAELHVDIEVDGAVHELKQKKDAARDAALKAKGVTILRIPAQQVLESPTAVAEHIRTVLLELRESRGGKM